MKRSRIFRPCVQALEGRNLMSSLAVAHPAAHARAAVHRDATPPAPTPAPTTLLIDATYSVLPNTTNGALLTVSGDYLYPGGQHQAAYGIYVHFGNQSVQAELTDAVPGIQAFHATLFIGALGPGKYTAFVDAVTDPVTGSFVSASNSFVIPGTALPPPAPATLMFGVTYRPRTGVVTVTGTYSWPEGEYPPSIEIDVFMNFQEVRGHYTGDSPGVQKFRATFEFGPHGLAPGKYYVIVRAWTHLFSPEEYVSAQNTLTVPKPRPVQM